MQEIDEYVNQAKERGYSAVLQLGSKGVNYATNVLMQTAIKVILPTHSSHLTHHTLPPLTHSPTISHTYSTR